MKKINKIILFLFLITIIQLFSSQYFKAIKITGKSAYKQFFLTEDIYENSKNNLGDIRIIDNAGKEVPYAIETLKNQNKNNVKVNLGYEVEKNGKSTILKIKSKFLPLKNIILDVNDEFQRNYAVRSGDNSPLKINGVTGNYVPDRVVFKVTERENYKITFGNENLEKPEYDIVEFVDSIKERDEVLVGKLEKSEGNNISKSKDYTVYYNVFIGFVVIVLIGFMVRKIDKNKK